MSNLKKHTRLTALVLASLMCLAMVPLFSSTVSATGTSAVSVLTYNMSNGNYDYTAVDTMITANNPDVVGMQEITALQWLSLPGMMTSNGYSNIRGSYRGTQGLEANECNPIFYKTSKFTLHNYGTFWLSDTPTVQSKYSDSAYYRICTWVVLQITGTDDYIIVLNTHLDTTATARFKQIKVLLAQQAAIETNAPNARDNLIQMGDYNMSRTDSMFKYITGEGTYNGESNVYTWARMKDSYALATSKVANSFGNYNTNPASNPTIPLDHIIICKRCVGCTEFKVSTAAGSDHLAVKGSLQLHAPI